MENEKTFTLTTDEFRFLGGLENYRLEIRGSKNELVGSIDLSDSGLVIIPKSNSAFHDEMRRNFNLRPRIKFR